MNFIKRNLPYKSIKKQWKERQLDFLYRNLHQPGYNQNYTDTALIKKRFLLYHDSIKEKNLNKVEKYLEPNFLNELNDYLKATKNSLFVIDKREKQLEEDEIAVDFTFFNKRETEHIRCGFR